MTVPCTHRGVDSYFQIPCIFASDRGWWRGAWCRSMSLEEATSNSFRYHLLFDSGGFSAMTQHPTHVSLDL